MSIFGLTHKKISNTFSFLKKPLMLHPVDSSQILIILEILSNYFFRQLPFLYIPHEFLYLIYITKFCINLSKRNF